MKLQRTDKARGELAAGERLLSVRERGALFLADGTKTQQELCILLQDSTGMVDKLLRDGYLVARSPSPAVVAQAPGPAPANVPPAPAGDKAASDNFDGRRSLATTRMFLFDICERMFVRRLPDMAIQYRDQLRGARDRESMLLIADQMLLTVAQIAGQDRADGLSERIAALLPLESEAV